MEKYLLYSSLFWKQKDRSIGFDFCGYYTHKKNLEDITYTLGCCSKVDIHFEKTGDGIKIIQSFRQEAAIAIGMQKQDLQFIF